jgi:hypothetical protein
MAFNWAELNGVPYEMEAGVDHVIAVGVALVTVSETVACAGV